VAAASQKIRSSRISRRLVDEYLVEVRGLPSVFGGFPSGDGQAGTRMGRIMSAVELPGRAGQRRREPDSELSAGEFAAAVVITDAIDLISSLVFVRDGGQSPQAVVALRHAARRLRADLRTFRPVLDRVRVDHLRAILLELDTAAELVDTYHVALSSWSGAVKGADRARLAMWIARLDAAVSLRSSAVDALATDSILVRLAGGIDCDVGVAAELAAATVVPGFLRRHWRQVCTSAATACEDGVEELAVWAEKAAFAAEASVPVIGEAARQLASSCGQLSTALWPARSAVVARRVLESRPGATVDVRVLDRLTEVALSRSLKVARRLPALVAKVAAAEAATVTPPAGYVIEAAGGVVWRRQGLALEVLVVHRLNRNDWSLPKGKCRPDESAEACALREVTEETGLVCEPGDELVEVTYRDRNGRAKHVRYWAMIPGEGVAVASGEVDEVRWAPYGEAMDLLTKRRDQEVLASLPCAREIAA
jgi:8-oxo-dGTP diphosphatase